VNWIFFDCFNTLIDDFDPEGDESGLGSLPELAVALGACNTREAFVAAYHAERVPVAPDHAERALDTRLAAALRALGALPDAAVSPAVDQLLVRWHDEYPKSLRITPGARETLEHWYGRRRLAVVSNFFVAGLPLAFLREFGLAHYFEFVIDSASLGYRKPGPRIFEAALARAGAAVHDVTFIGDRLDLDIIPAHALGMRVVHLDRSATRPGPVARDPRFPSVLHHSQFRDERSDRARVITHAFTREAAEPSENMPAADPDRPNRR
jgi:putative hydrolase of the HAD superfamily